MRKHFLLFFLMTILPLAGWANDVDISTATVVVGVDATNLSYNDGQNLPTVQTVKVNNVTYYASEWPQLFTLKFYKKVNNAYVAQNADQVQNAGTYAVTVVAKGATDADRGITYTADKENTNKTDFVIHKIDLQVNLSNGTKQYGAADPTSLEVEMLNLPTGYSIPTFTFANLPRTAGNDVSSAGYAYTFTLNDGTQTDITAQNYNVIIKNQPKLVITKKAIVLDYKNNATQPSKVYGVDELNAAFLTAIVNKANYDLHTNNALENADELSTVLTGIDGANVVTTSYSYVGEKESANADKDGAALTNPAAHKLTINIADFATNYTFTVTPIDLTVKQAKLFTGNTAPFTFSKAETADFTYDATAKSVTKTLTYTANNTVLLQDGANPAVTPQVNVTYKYKATTTAAESNPADTKTAGIYCAYVTPVENGNFYIEDASLRVDAFDFTINKKALYLYVTDEAITKTYKGSAYTLPTSQDITIQGLAEGDATTYADAIAAVKAVNQADNTANNDKVTACNTYNIIPSVAADNALRTNYNVQPYATTYQITPLAITITPKDKLNVVYGSNIAGTSAATTGQDANVTVTKDNAEDPDIVANDLQTVLSAYNVVIADQTYAAGGEYPGAITLVQKDLDPTNDAAIIAMLNNFTITATATGKVTIGAGDYTLVVKDKNITYGDELSWNTFNYLTSGLPAQTVPASVKYILVNTADDTEVYSQNDGDPLPINAGTYTIKVDTENSNLTIANYTTPTEAAGTLIAGTLTIDRKAITFKLDPVTINTGATKAALQTMGASKVSIVETTDQTKSGLAYAEDEIDFVLEYVADATGTTLNTNKVVLVGGTGTDANDMKNTTPVDTYVGGYKIVAPTQVAENADNANYDITFNVVGTLNVVAGNVLVLNQQSDDLMNTLEVADGVQYDVTLDGLSFGGNATMNAKKWYSLVLPFEISVAQLSSTLGYAIVNRMDQTTSDGNVHFRLTFDKIPANEPFLVKAVKGVNGNVTDPITINGKTFEDVIISKPDGVTVSISTQDATPIVFTGVYEKKHYLDPGDKLYAGIASDNFYQVSKANYNWLDPFRSFWTSPANARVFVEDLDENNTTVIKEISAETMNEISADGWYTVNGIKLQSVPTQKGVYIVNGKKVVLK